MEHPPTLRFSLQLQIFLSFVLSLAFLTTTTTTITQGQEEEEDQFVYSGFSGGGGTGLGLTLDGTATVTPDGVLKLTNGTLHLKGHAFYPTPCRFRKSPNGAVQSFSVTFVFCMVPVYSDQCTDGMTFLISPTKDFSGAQHSQYLGLLNKTTDGKPSNQIFAVELDSSQNTEFDDIDDNHVGIDINSLTSTQVRPAGFYDDKKGGAFNNLTLVSRKEMQVWVDYDADTTKITVTLAPLKVAKPSRPLVSTTYNLSTVLRDKSYLGFSASTGPINSLYCVLGWSLGINRAAPDIDMTKLPKLPRIGPKPRPKAMEIVLPIASATFIFLVGTSIVLLVRRRRKYAELHEDWEDEYGPHRFSYKDLFHATQGFHNKNLLGHGGFGKVYKGVLPVSKLEVAVKRVSHESKQGIKEFIAEIVSIGRIRHRNIVQLLGYCRRKGELLLVYEYMSNGSLDRYLYVQEEEDAPTLDWGRRFEIIKGVASGLFYLHERWEKVVVHRDIKASNVLVDGEMNGRLGDFGLSRLYEHGTDPQTTRVVGTMGYFAPELARTGKATPLTDVYAFGIFILEVTCGRRPIVDKGVEEDDGSEILVDWVVEHCRKGSLMETVDMRLRGSSSDPDEVCLALKIGLLCAHPFGNVRPSMRQVMKYLDGETPVPELMPTTLSYSMMGVLQNDGFSDYASLSATVSSRNGITSSSSFSAGR
ncbi:L-type lectin-domain containing receptor kinase SIT2-like [Hordeum vulgare subsp. vulgare]|uniref:non-specific serine/threonine protein kinase n=1 Tax=Hordeum vulgare subsp. vulgare TaxID=112509 RepID=A0A8I6YHB5_HORVV|nr:L-type lectin-domain containing receptor kinase SIT2-like [Hordeum vulgare subsp. vulgare]